MEIPSLIYYNNPFVRIAGVNIPIWLNETYMWIVTTTEPLATCTLAFFGQDQY